MHKSIVFLVSALALVSAQRNRKVSVKVGNARVQASVDLPTTASGIAAAAVSLDSGNYIFENVATGQTLHYDRTTNGQELYPDDGEGHPINVQFLDDNYAVIKPAASNGKCMSAQWDYDLEGGTNWAGALYQCRVGTFALSYSKRAINTRAQIKLRLAKQYWYLIPGSTDNSYKIIPLDHLQDMDPRAIGSGLREARNGGMRYPELVLNDNTDTNQEWFLKATGSNDDDN